MIYSGDADKLIGDLATRNFLQEAQTLRAMIGGDGKRAFHREGDGTYYNADSLWSTIPAMANEQQKFDDAYPFIEKCVQTVLQYDWNKKQEELISLYPDGYGKLTYDEIVRLYALLISQGFEPKDIYEFGIPVVPIPQELLPMNNKVTVQVVQEEDNGKQKKKALSKA